MKAKPSRRGFLRATGLVAMGFATGGTIICAADYAWALSTTAIDGHTAETLLVVARQLFPHDRLGDQYYAVMVDSLDKQAAGDPALRKLLVDGVGRRRAQEHGGQRVLRDFAQTKWVLGEVDRARTMINKAVGRSRGRTPSASCARQA